MEELDGFINYLNGVHSAVKFTQKVSVTKVPYGPADIYKSVTRLNIRVYVKPTDKNMYLKYDSEHPYSLRYSMPY